MQAHANAGARLEPFDVGSRPAIATTRGGIVESEHFVCFAVCRADGTIRESSGDVERPLFMRSAAKPLISAVVAASGAYERFGLDDVELAVATGSHSGEPKHVAAVHSILRKIGLDESALQCGPHPPIHGPSAAALVARGEKPRAIHNNCSGKHAGILALAMQLGAGAANYLAPGHPAEALILDGCAELLDVPRSRLIIGTDGCGIPAIAVPIRNAATFFARMSDPESFGPRWRDAVARVRDAMIAHPDYVAGTDRFDTALMQSAPSEIACKGGAEGYHAVAALAAGFGMSAKVADGSARAVPPFVVDRLARLGALSPDQARRLQSFRVVPIANHAGVQVGEIRALPS